MRKKITAVITALTLFLTMLCSLPIMAEDSVLLNSDFEAGLGGWSKWAGTVAIADSGHSSDSSAVATARTELWHAPVYNADSILLQTFTYQFSAWVKFESGTDTIKFAVKYADENGDTHYDTIAEGEVGTTWTELAAEWTAPEGSFSYEIYFETLESTEDFYVDDVVIIGDKDATLPEPAGDPLSIDFEDGEKHGWSVRGGGNDTVEISTAYAHSGTNSLFDSGRNADWNAPCIFVSSLVPQGKTYTYSLWVYYTGGTYQMNFDLTATYSLNGVTQYPSFATQTVMQGQWTQISGNFTIPKGATTTAVYVGPSPSEANSTLEYYIDDFSLAEAVFHIQDDIPNLKDVFAQYGFKLGSAMMSSEVSSEYNQSLFLKHFNSITFGNELKPEAILDQAMSQQMSKKGDDLNPQVNLQSADSLIQFAIANDLPIRGHTLVWHSQTPDWFFKEGYKDSGEWLSKADMQVRLENYIKNVFFALETQYPKANFYAYDVVNEAFSDEGGMRPAGGYTLAQQDGNYEGSSAWIQVYGDDTFIDDAFRFARKYAPEGCKLFYNDYNEYMGVKRDHIVNKVTQLYNDGLLDGVGMQSHLGAYFPDLADSEYAVYYQALEKYSAIGCEIQITELDITADDITEQNKVEKLAKQTEQYKQLFDLVLKFKTEKNANITAVVIWGMLDSNSWRSERLPLLFDKDYQAKDAFYAIVDGRYDPDDEKFFTTNPIKAPEETTTQPPVTTTPPTGSVLVGDIDCDGGVGKMADIVLLAKYFKGVIKLDSQALTNAQCTKGDSIIDTEDLSTLINYLLGSVSSLPF
ncbi:MAG: endo-1,4-beta-xylanase [Oscillospiraceae bacterium]|jgi:endo-1,4-beta-xylanase|nr:endo-1,4-beta-xylanase [Oscillospiraceae bacterium]